MTEFLSATIWWVPCCSYILKFFGRACLENTNSLGWRRIRKGFLNTCLSGFTALNEWVPNVVCARLRKFDVNCDRLMDYLMFKFQLLLLDRVSTCAKKLLLKKVNEIKTSEYVQR